MGTSYPDQAWRSRAACADADPEIFDWKDATELGVPNAQTPKLNKARFAVAKEYCVTCPVISECEADAVYAGDVAWGVRGGLSPYDRPDVRPGNPMSDTQMVRDEAARALERAWEWFLEGGTFESGPYVPRGPWRAMQRAFVEGREPDAEWDEYTGYVNDLDRHRRTVRAGSGWAVSQSGSASIVKVMYYDRAGRLVSRLAKSSRVRYDSLKTPRVLKKWPDEIDLPKIDLPREGLLPIDPQL